jgi:CheY-like chemotaxis protein
MASETQFKLRSGMSSPNRPVTADVISTAEVRRALILVVERNPAVQRLERYLLEQAGFSVEFSGDGETALLRARELRPKIVVTEILVPRRDGLSLCRALKADPETKDIVVLVFSHLQAEERALEAGANAFLVKPLDEEHLIGTVARLLELSLGGEEVKIGD